MAQSTTQNLAHSAASTQLRVQLLFCVDSYLLGDRKGIEKQTTTWDKTVIDRSSDLKNWVDLLREMVNNKKIRKLFAYANNHYAGRGPATVKMFCDLWQKK